MQRVTVPHDVRGPTDDVSLLWRISTHHAQDDEKMRVPFQVPGRALDSSH
jgi:hypothetical protein